MHNHIPMELDKKLHENNLFKEWKNKHPNSFLTHYFCQISPDFNLKKDWEVGYYKPKEDKMVVFVLGEEIKIKEDDQVFKKPDDKIEQLDQEKMKIVFDDALKIFKDNYLKLFPKTLLGDGFVVLQTIKGKTLWNFTFVTKSIKFINMKINSEDGKIESHQTVELMNKN